MGEELIYSIYLRRCDKLSEEASSVSNVVVLVILGQRQDVVAEKTSLFRSGEDQLCSQVDRLQLYYVTLRGKGGGEYNIGKEIEQEQLEEEKWHKH